MKWSDEEESARAKDNNEMEKMPDLTDISNSEEVKNGTDQQDESSVEAVGSVPRFKCHGWGFFILKGGVFDGIVPNYQ